MAAEVVAFPSAGTEVVGHLRDADVGVLMSDPRELAEGCPNSVMEYMACGLPVVCADSGGCRELVSDGVTGFVVPPGDPQALVEKLVYLREHAEQARRLGSAGRSRVATEFTVDRMVQGFIRVYREAISRGRQVS
jgi:glycosyltransferase involved in cell wall biosynthesis